MRRACEELVMLLDRHKNNDLYVTDASREVIEDNGLESVMFCIASSTFRMNLLLHFEKKKRLDGNLIPSDQFDAHKDISQQYHDYISELGNSLCGTISRILGDAGFSTGTSTPAILKVARGTSYIQALNPDTEYHLSCSMKGNTLVFASLYLFINNSCKSNFLIQIREDQSSNFENAGELEFF